MADIRESFLSPSATTRRPVPSALARWWPRVKLGLRRAVVTTSVPPIRSLYAAIYRAHIWYAVRVLRQLPGIKAIYVKRGAFGREAVFGVSDIDLLVFGDWNETEQARSSQAVAQLAAKSPLYDTASVTQVHNVNSLQTLYLSDYFFQYKLNQAREQSILVFGQPILAGLPPVPADCALGGYYMEAKLWWMMHTTSVFGSGPTTWDPIFRNSLAYKNVAELANLRAAAEGAPLEALIIRGLQELRNLEVRLNRRWVHSMESLTTTLDEQPLGTPRAAA
jgi:hypothetical protein